MGDTRFAYISYKYMWAVLGQFLQINHFQRKRIRISVESVVKYHPIMIKNHVLFNYTQNLPVKPSITTVFSEAHMALLCSWRCTHYSVPWLFGIIETDTDISITFIKIFWYQILKTWIPIYLYYHQFYT